MPKCWEGNSLWLEQDGQRYRGKRSKNRNVNTEGKSRNREFHWHLWFQTHLTGRFLAFPHSIFAHLFLTVRTLAPKILTHLLICSFLQHSSPHLCHYKKQIYQKEFKICWQFFFFPPRLRVHGQRTIFKNCPDNSRPPPPLFSMAVLVLWNTDGSLVSICVQFRVFSSYFSWFDFIFLT